MYIYIYTAEIVVPDETNVFEILREEKRFNEYADDQ